MGTRGFDHRAAVADSMLSLRQPVKQDGPSVAAQLSALTQTSTAGLAALTAGQPMCLASLAARDSRCTLSLLLALLLEAIARGR